MIKPTKYVDDSILKRIFMDYDIVNKEDLEGCYRILECACGKEQMAEYIEDCLSIKEVIKFISTFSQREIKIIELRFWKMYSLKQISEKMNVTGECIRQIQTNILKKFNSAFSREDKVNLIEAKDSISNMLEEDSIHRVNIPIGMLQLSSRTFNLLINAGVNTIDELLFMSEQELLQLKGISVRSVKEIKENLNKFYGINIGELNLSKRNKMIKQAKKQIEEGKGYEVDIPTEMLGLETKVNNLLRRKNVHTIGDLFSEAEKEILQIRKTRNITEKNIIERLNVLLDVDFDKISDFIEKRLNGDVTYMFDIPIEFLKLSTRPYNLLKRKKIKTIGKLISKIDELQDIKYMGAAGKDEILNKLEDVLEIRINKDEIGNIQLLRTLIYKESVDSLQIRSEITSELKKKGLDTIGKIISKTEEELVKKYGIKKYIVEIIRSAIKEISPKLDFTPDPNSIEWLGFSINLIDKLHKNDIFDISELKYISCEELLMMEDLSKEDVLTIVRKQKEIV